MKTVSRRGVRQAAAAWPRWALSEFAHLRAPVVGVLSQNQHRTPDPVPVSDAGCYARGCFARRPYDRLLLWHFLACRVVVGTFTPCLGAGWWRSRVVRVGYPAPRLSSPTTSAADTAASGPGRFAQLLRSRPVFGLRSFAERPIPLAATTPTNGTPAPLSCGKRKRGHPEHYPFPLTNPPALWVFGSTFHTPQPLVSLKYPQ
jgi:hypothetical protein